MTDITDRMYGCLVGGAVGDALGAVVEGWPYHRVRETYGRVEEFHAYENPMTSGTPGEVTDDTVLQSCICLAIERADGRVTPDDVSDVLTERLNPDRMWVSEEVVLKKLFVGMDPWESGRGSVPAATALMGIAPVGAINLGNPAQAYQDGFNVASLNQEGIERDAAAAFAAAIATALAPESTVQDALDTLCEYAHGKIYRAIDIAIAIAEAAKSVNEFVARFYETRLDWTWPGVEWDRSAYDDGALFSASSVEVLPIAAGILYLVGTSPNKAIIEAASFGRDSDTIASTVGNLVGANSGASALRDEWTARCEEANEDLFVELYDDSSNGFERMSERMVDALASERDRATDRGSYLDDVLDR